MDLDSPNITIEDDSIIREVLAGRRDQFQELVRRYADKVYGVAWSRLGDRHLAEEVVQETFIQGFQQLHRLKDTDKFLPWISTIARNKAINLGMRFRNELKRRERWALEQIPSDAETIPNKDQDPVTKETLRETLASLNGAQRECLTLFYLQGKSVEEASKSLGITAGNFKTRLHRARTALRTKLETLLEKELGQFKPSDQVRHGIMAVVLAKSTSGTGFKAIGAWLPAIPFFSSLIFMVQFVAMIPGFLFAKWTLKQTMNNLKDQEGFRSKILRANAHKIYWIVVIILILIFLALNIQMDQLILILIIYGLFLIHSVVYMVQFCVLKHAFPPVLFICCGLLLVSMGLGMYDASFNSLNWVSFGIMFASLGFISRSKGEGRLDHSIFLRMSDQMNTRKSEYPKSDNKPFPPTTKFIKSFIEFLSKENNLVSMRTEIDGVRTWVTPIHGSGLRLMFAPIWRKNLSSVFFGNTGNIKAQLGKKDRCELIKLGLLKDGDVSALERKVETGLMNAWGYWSNDQNQMAKFAMGYERDEHVYHKPPERLLGNRIRWISHIIIGVLFMILGLWQQFDLNWGTPSAVKRMREPDITEAEAKAYIQDFLSDKVPSQVIRKRLLDRVSNAQVFPPLDWLPEENKQKIREYLETFKKIDAATFEFKRMNDDFKIDDLWRYGSMRILLESLFDLDFVKDIDWNARINAQDSRWKTPDRVWFEQTSTSHIYVSGLQHRLAALSGYVDFSQIDFSETHEWLLEMQCLDTSKDFWNFKKVDLKKVHGLFLGEHSPLYDTWNVLSVLEMTDGLDLIDKDACIEGILRLHYGGGRFYLRAVNSKQYVPCNPHTTWRAFQSLRILNALDRVDDLAEWKFLLPIKFKSVSSLADRSKDFELNGHHWDEVEAFLMQREFDAYMRDRR